MKVNTQVFPFVVKQDNVEIEFSRECGGFPSRVLLKEAEGTETVIIENNSPQLRITLGDGRQLHPFVSDTCEVSRYTTADGAERIEFARLFWRDAGGATADKFRMSLRHEFWLDGTAFTSAFFMAEDNQPPDIGAFELSMPVRLDAFDDVRWGFFPRPTTGVDGAFIQTIATARFIDAGVGRRFDGQIVPEVNFNCFRKNAPGVYLEFFMDGQNSLSGKPNDNSSSVFWQGRDAVRLDWNFQKETCENKRRPWQWQNQWGWIVKQAPTARHLPPLRMYHYFDSYQRYPAREDIADMAAAGADLLIFHENWRLDAQNGGVPYDTEKFKRLTAIAHEHGLRVAVYIRGDELSAAEESCDWFDSMLEKDRDGLYMDYGGPIHETLMPNERFQGGRIAFRRHFLKLRRYRERVGRDGVLLAHTGPFFSALGMTGGNVDGYVSGEGEQGILVQGRKEHEYFSEAFACCGSMWTAAFPEYGTARMVPFLAATGQSPHAPLGQQLKSSSLSHPGAPGINDVYLRPLWKLWGLFSHERDIAVFNDYNCRGVLSHANEHTGGYLMIAGNKKSALLILTNFSEKTRLAKTTINWQATGFDATDARPWRCRPTLASPGVPEESSDKAIFAAEIEGFGVAGWLLTCEPAAFKPVLSDYAAPYPPPGKAAVSHKQRVEQQRVLRDNPKPAEKLFLRVHVPSLTVPYEDSLYWDLYENALELGCFDADDKFKRLGWLGKTGLAASYVRSQNPKQASISNSINAEKTETQGRDSESEFPKEEIVWPEEYSDWVPLHELLPQGIHRLGIRSLHQGKPFYSFITMTLSPERNADHPDAYAIEFMNELEPDRAFIRTTVNLAGNFG